MRRSLHSKTEGKSQAGELFLVATPIGNLADITLRALETLKSVDVIACEDTRTSGTLLAHYGIKTPKTSYHTHNEARATSELIVLLKEGKRIALISDAGTPLLSDPGARLVRTAIEHGIRVTPIPGASALLSALIISGLPAEQFLFFGFLPSKSQERGRALASLTALQISLVFYEAPHRLSGTLAALLEAFGPREAAVARELTKLHEECVRGTLAELQQHFHQHTPRGECVILVQGGCETSMSDDAIDRALAEHLASGSLRQAVDIVTEVSARPRSEIYARALALKGDA